MLSENHTYVIPKGPVNNIVSGNDLVLNWRQSISRTNDVSFHWRIYASQGLSALIESQYLHTVAPGKHLDSLQSIEGNATLEYKHCWLEFSS